MLCEDPGMAPGQADEDLHFESLFESWLILDKMAVSSLQPEDDQPVDCHEDQKVQCLLNAQPVHENRIQRSRVLLFYLV